MDRPVDQILAEWRRLERELESATDPESQEVLLARIAEVRDEHARTVDDVMAHGMERRPDTRGR